MKPDDFLRRPVMPILLLVRVLLAGMMVAGMGSTALAAEDSTTGAVRQKNPPPRRCNSPTRGPCQNTSGTELGKQRGQLCIENCKSCGEIRAFRGRQAAARPGGATPAAAAARLANA